MQKKSKILGIAAFAAAFGAWGALFGAYKDSAQVIFPAGGFEIYTLTDAESGGFSTSEMTSNDTAVSARVNIRSGKAYAYAGFGFNLTSVGNRPSGHFDFSRFDSLAVVVETGRMRSVTLRILTEDPVYSTPGKYLTYRPLEKEIAVPGKPIEVAVSLMDFKNKEWWLVAQGLDKDDGLSYLYRAAMLEVFNGEGALRGIPDDIELKSVRLWGENRDFQKGMFFALAAMLLLLGGFIYMAFRKPRDAKALEAQLKEAARLLKQTDKSIAEIAIAVGFKSSSRLEREFCRLYGKKPLEYRKKDV